MDSTQQATVERAVTRLLESRTDADFRHAITAYYTQDADFIHPLIVAKGRAEITGAFRVWRSLYRQSQHKTHVIWYHDRAAPAVLDAVAWRRAHVDPVQVARRHEEDVPAATGSEAMERVVTLEVVQDAHVLVAGKVQLHGITQLTLRGVRRDLLDPEAKAALAALDTQKVGEDDAREAGVTTPTATSAAAQTVLPPSPAPAGIFTKADANGTADTTHAGSSSSSSSAIVWQVAKHVDYYHAPVVPTLFVPKVEHAVRRAIAWLVTAVWGVLAWTRVLDLLAAPRKGRKLM
ncbi:hypothetical protein GGF32_006042 [Allomyces javanicus]|nr:hypothetical protein GGF32_006042 [Allomyces javanicus]